MQKDARARVGDLIVSSCIDFCDARMSKLHVCALQFTMLAVFDYCIGTSLMYSGLRPCRH